MVSYYTGENTTEDFLVEDWDIKKKLNSRENVLQFFRGKENHKIQKYWKWYPDYGTETGESIWASLSISIVV